MFRSPDHRSKLCEDGGPPGQAWCMLCGRECLTCGLPGMGPSWAEEAEHLQHPTFYPHRDSCVFPVRRSAHGSQESPRELLEVPGFTLLTLLWYRPQHDTVHTSGCILTMATCVAHSLHSLVFIQAHILSAACGLSPAATVPKLYQTLESSMSLPEYSSVVRACTLHTFTQVVPSLCSSQLSW